MQEKRFYTVAEFARAEGISTQAAYKRLKQLATKLPTDDKKDDNLAPTDTNQLPTDFIIKENGKTLIDYIAYREKTGVKTEEPAADQVESVTAATIVAVVDRLQDQHEKQLSDLRENYEKQLAEQRANSEKRLQEKDARIDDLRQAAETWRVAFESAQALHAGTIQKQLTEAAQPLTDTENPAPKHWWSGIWKRRH